MLTDLFCPAFYLFLSWLPRWLGFELLGLLAFLELFLEMVLQVLVESFDFVDKDG